MAKPTTPFGSIIFGCDGSVRPDIYVLSPEKAEQEFEVARRFLAHAQELVGRTLSVERLDERDHDFRLISSDAAPIDVQCTEVVFHDFLLPTGAEGNHHWTKLPDGSTRAVDQVKLDAVLATKIDLKLKKHYARIGRSELWLLIWSVTGYPMGSYIEGGQRRISAAVEHAQAFLQSSGRSTFDRIIFFNMVTRPTQIWPPDERW